MAGFKGAAHVAPHPQRTSHPGSDEIHQRKRLFCKVLWRSHASKGGDRTGHEKITVNPRWRHGAYNVPMFEAQAGSSASAAANVVNGPVSIMSTGVADASRVSASHRGASEDAQGAWAQPSTADVGGSTPRIDGPTPSTPPAGPRSRWGSWATTRDVDLHS